MSSYQVPELHPERRPRRAAPSRPGRAPRRPRPRVIGSYRGADGELRELIVVAARAGTSLVIDRDPAMPGEELLIAHLASDEPPQNALIACRCYLESDPAWRRCRTVGPHDELVVPFQNEDERRAPRRSGEWPPVQAAGAVFQLRLLPSRSSIPQLRWARLSGGGDMPVAVSLRDAIASLERYEPFRELTGRAVRIHAGDRAVSTTVLRAELARVLESPIVLNRGLREAVLAQVAAGRTTMSEIAMRCGRTKRDGKGGESGETSWVARRIGLLPEGGQREPTVWVHSDVLGLIARRGLWISPREVELG